MRTGKQWFLTVAAFILIAVYVYMLFNTAFLNEFDPATVAECALEFVLVIIAFFYVLSGFSKKLNLNYKLFFIIDAATFVIAYLFFAFDTTAAEDFTQVMIGVAVEFICFGAVILLAFAPDLGKKKSLIAVYTMVAVYALCAAYYAIAYFCGGTSESFLYLVWEYLGYIPECLIAVILVYGKYTDKALRKEKDADK